MNEYIITETDLPTSLDPLDADQTQNLPVARMIYATPLEIDASDTITSQVLETFSCDKASKTIHWTLKKEQKYSDGSEMSIDDIAFSVIRMLYTRPKFPVIESIEGVSEWLKLPEPLKSYPQGLQIKNNEITIRLTQDYPHPLFRFCLELFSIIPKKCVDLKTNKIICDKIPESGRYMVKEKKEKEILFQNRVKESNQIVFKYLPAIDLAKQLNQISNEAVIAGNESMFTGDELKLFRGHSSFYYLPASRFSVLQINSEIAPFDDKICRLVFANQFRKEYEKLTKEYSPSESSIFTKIIPGYLTRKELEVTVFNKLKKPDLEKCIQKLRKNQIKWGYVENEKNSAFVQAFISTLKSLKLKGEPIILKTRKDQADQFVNGNLALFKASSGFWANDPVGDLQMLFTFDLHKPLNFISKDQNLQELIKNLVQNQSDKNKYIEINKYLHDQAKFNIYSHVRRFYFSKAANKLKQIPQGSASPTPWQVFE